MTSNLKPHRKVKLFNIQIDALDMHDSVSAIQTLLSAEFTKCHFVVTPNVDHIVKLDTNPLFKAAYNNAALVLADGRPVVMASGWFDERLPGTVPGSDLVPAIFDRFQSNNQPLKIFLLGAMPGVATKAAKEIRRLWPIIQVCGIHSPDFGFEKNTEDCEAICRAINTSGADLLIIGLGAPKQELWINQYASQLTVKVALCVGATIDFIAGEKPRAPKWMRILAVEWLHRMASEPKRLASRYLHDALVFPKLLYKEWMSRK